MSHTMTVEQAAARLGELVSAMGPNEEIVLTQNNRPVARLVPSAPRKRRQAGNCKGMLVLREEDDEHLKDFKEYMP